MFMFALAATCFIHGFETLTHGETKKCGSKLWGEVDFDGS